MDFTQYATVGNQYLNRLAQELQMPLEQAEAGSILRGVLHALRNHVTVEESCEMISHLPMALKGVYVDGWKPQRSIGSSNHLDDFIQEVVEDDGMRGLHDFRGASYAKFVVGAVFRSLQKSVADSEYKKFISAIPKDIKVFIQDSMVEKKPC
ncbi:DUF2267 domain-containing protein [Xanthocytophaga agilis]|uniref:DUF2267 domain-containing protein n=1 Tax=Xanthocytophaga agilis TaxID=3048010 RepID=A0AAE3REF2_9BACT|nr:DUF2267 domain-containing protein [Xanthocytophaga agilis]MDJ1506453.1 DUF2267 domain-containing protein [Xanthocytophaga agilis]